MWRTEIHTVCSYPGSEGAVSDFGWAAVTVCKGVDRGFSGMKGLWSMENCLMVAKKCLKLGKKWLLLGRPRPSLSVVWFPIFHTSRKRSVNISLQCEKLILPAYSLCSFPVCFATRFGVFSQSARVKENIWRNWQKHANSLAGSWALYFHGSV